MSERKKFWINAQFQLRYLRSILLIELVVMLVTSIVSLSVAFMLTSPTFEMGPQWTDIAGIFVAEAVMLGGILIYFGIRASHRICGATFRIVTDLAAIRRGEPIDKIRLRQSDEFHELADAINETVDYLRAEAARQRVFRHAADFEDAPGGFRPIPEIMRH